MARKKTLTRTELRLYKTLLMPVLYGRETWKINKGTTELPACRRLLFPLLHAKKGRLRNAVAISCSSVPLAGYSISHKL